MDGLGIVTSTTKQNSAQYFNFILFYFVFYIFKKNVCFSLYIIFISLKKLFLFLFFFYFYYYFYYILKKLVSLKKKEEKKSFFYIKKMFYFYFYY